MGKDYQFVRLGLIESTLLIGTHIKWMIQVSMIFISVQGCFGNTRGMCIVVK